MRTTIATGIILLNAASAGAAQRIPTPATQAAPAAQPAPTALTLRDASRNDRWLGLGAYDVRWAPGGSVVYFRWNENPQPDDVPEADPWFRTGRDGRWIERVTDPAEARAIPGANMTWSPNGRLAAWSSGPGVFLFRDGQSRAVVTLGTAIESVRFHGNSAVDFSSGETLYRYVIADGSLTLLASRYTVEATASTAEGAWLAAQQQELFAHIRTQGTRRAEIASAGREGALTQPVPVKRGQRLENIQLTPDGRYVTFRVRNPATARPSTEYIDFLDASGYSAVRTAREKAGEPRDTVRMGILPFDPTVSPDSLDIMWITLSEAGGQLTVPHGPYWSPGGRRALVQFIGEDHQDVWYAELDVVTGIANVITHDHDDAWIGGPPVQANYLQPALLQWLPDGSWVFASERTGWSHLYRVDQAGTISPLTTGTWEVRGAALSRDRASWLLQTSREHPSDDHLYRMPAAGGDLVRLTGGQGRNEGVLSPDGESLAMIHSTATTLPDLWVGPVRAGDRARVTMSGTGNYAAHRLADPVIVSFPHPDGDLVWAALYTPANPHPARPAVIHVHGGGYRQFAHRGWSVYGWAQHLGLLNYLVQQGYTVLDFDYRGGAGFGRDYRTDIARSMGIKDADGVAAAARYLAREQGIDPARIGMHGVSYGGFLTLMTLFRHPGVVSAGIARASVTDWAHYSDGWTSRILGVPYEDAGAYERSSPIYYADGLQDHLLITHGIVDDNVHFQDAARLVQKLIELEKAFDVMVYPAEPHTIQTEPSRYDFVRRAVAFFDEHLTGGR